MQKLRIIYQDDEILAVEKPAGFQVHTPEHMTSGGRVLRQNNVMRILRNQCQKWVYPVHRLDRATSGVLLMAFQPESAALLQKQFKEKTVKKTYIALARGWVDTAGRIEDESGAITQYELLAPFELPIANDKFSTSLYSLVRASPLTGKFHQIRRHFKSISHPLIGDTVYGNGRHNQIWRELLNEKKLFLMAHSLRIIHPKSGKSLYFESKFHSSWHRVFELAGVCPYLNSNQD